MAKFHEKHEHFDRSPQGKDLLDLLKADHTKYVRSLISTENEAVRGKIQLVQNLTKDIFGVDLLE
jgi:hypothetical protein